MVFGMHRAGEFSVVSGYSVDGPDEFTPLAWAAVLPGWRHCSNAARIVNTWFSNFGQALQASKCSFSAT